MRNVIAIAAVTLGLTLVVDGALGDEGSGDKSGYTLFDPTPAGLMRDFNPDRPSVTQGPYTVDAGHWQAEFSFLEYTHDDGRDGASSESYAVMPANLRVGLLNNLELAVAVEPFQTVHTVGPRSLAGHGRSSTDSGFGDVQLTAKWNLWGNDGGGKTAFGVMPFVRLPTGAAGLSSHHVEGGVILPVAVQELPGGFQLGAEIEFNILRNDANDGYGVEFIHSAVVSHGLGLEGLNGYVEYVGVAPAKTGESYLAYVDAGLTYALGKNVDLDVGVNVAASRHAADYTLFSGLSFRL